MVKIYKIMGKEHIKVLHIDTEKGWRGGQQQAAYLFENMHKQNFKTALICQPNSKFEAWAKALILPFYAIKMRNEADIIAAFKIAKICKKEQFNILHLHSGHAMAIGMLVKLFYKKIKLIGVKRVDFALKNNFFSKLKHNKMDTVVCISNKIRQVMLDCKIAERKLHVIHSGVDTIRYKGFTTSSDYKKNLGINPEHILIGTIAALVGHKDYPNLLKAAEIVINETDNISFLAAGNGKNEQEIKQLASNLNLKNRFVFAGYRKDIGNLLSCFDIFVLASKMEGLGTSILDAQSAGTPVIATNAGGIPEIVLNNKTGLLVNKKNPKALAKAIITLSNDEILQQKLKNSALEFVEGFSIKNTVQKNISLYLKLLEKQ